MKENLKKSSRLVYLISLTIISLFLFILPDRDDSLIGDPIDDFYRDQVRSYAFQYCKIEKKPGIAGLFKYMYVDKCSRLSKTIEINNIILDADAMYKTGKYSWRVNEMYKAFNEYNEENKNIQKYKIYEFDTYKKAKNYTNITMWILFIISLPLIWFSRNFSIVIVNLVMSIIKKGWKKI
jgi:hypothetical protein